jgi:hypothetical protein
VAPVNDPPRLKWIGDTEGRVTVTEGTGMDLVVEGSDVDGDPITYSSNSTDFAPDPLDGDITLTPDDEHVGETIVSISVSDGFNATSQDVTFVVLNLPERPVIAPIPAQFAKVGHPFTLTVNATDPDGGDLLEYTVQTNLFDIKRKSGLISFTPTAGQAGEHIVKVMVSDGTHQVEAYFNITIEGDVEEGGGGDDLFSGDFAGTGVSLGVLLLIIVTCVVAVVGSIVMLALRRKRSSKDAEMIWTHPEKGREGVEPGEEIDVDELLYGGGGNSADEGVVKENLPDKVGDRGDKKQVRKKRSLRESGGDGDTGVY